jgi:hypothetical protein
MWYNGFLQTLELRPRSLISILPSSRLRRSIIRLRPESAGFRVDRATLSGTGRWTVATEQGERREATLICGWVSGGGSVVALGWRVPASGRLKFRAVQAWLVSGDHDVQTWRRFIVRLRMQI